MGTFHDSKIVTAAKDHVCRDCRTDIKKGDQYLRYQAGLKNSYPLCLNCAMTPSKVASIDYKYDCQAIRDYVETSGI